MIPGYGKGAEFDAADYYDCSPDSELLAHGSPEGALENFLDGLWEKGKGCREILEGHGPIEVFAFKRKTVDRRFAELVVDSWMDDFDEMHWCEEYGNFEDVSDPFKDEKALRAELTTVLQKHLDTATVWQCEQVASATFSVEEIAALVPDWFRDEP
jgi:hypothetical protein